MRRFLQEILEKKSDKEILVSTYYITDVQFFLQDYSKEENVKVRLNLQILLCFEKVPSYIFLLPDW